MGRIVVDQLNLRVELRFRMLVVGLLCGSLQVLFHLSNKSHVFLEQGSVFLAQFTRRSFQILGDVVQYADQAFLVLHLPVHFLKHLMGVVDGGDRLVRSCVGHASPRVRPIRYRHTELQGTETGAGLVLALEMTFYLLVDRNATGPARGCVGTALNVSAVQFLCREQATDSPHVVVAVAAHSVVHPFERKDMVLERSQRFHNWLQVEFTFLPVGPKMFGQGSVGGKHDHEPLLGLSDFLGLQSR